MSMIILIVDDTRNKILTQASEISTTIDQYYTVWLSEDYNAWVCL